MGVETITKTPKPNGSYDGLVSDCRLSVVSGGPNFVEHCKSVFGGGVSCGRNEEMML